MTSMVKASDAGGGFWMYVVIRYEPTARLKRSTVEIAPKIIASRARDLPAPGSIGNSGLPFLYRYLMTK